MRKKFFSGKYKTFLGRNSFFFLVWGGGGGRGVWGGRGEGVRWRLVKWLDQVNLFTATVCRRIKWLDRVIVKIKRRKQKNLIMHKCKYLGTKILKFTNIKFSGRLFVSESMSHEIQLQQLPYKCQQLESYKKIHATCFFFFLTIFWTLNWENMEKYTKIPM